MDKDDGRVLSLTERRAREYAKQVDQTEQAALLAVSHFSSIWDRAVAAAAIRALAKGE